MTRHLPMTGWDSMFTDTKTMAFTDTKKRWPDIYRWLGETRCLPTPKQWCLPTPNKDDQTFTDDWSETRCLPTSKDDGYRHQKEWPDIYRWLGMRNLLGRYKQIFAAGNQVGHLQMTLLGSVYSETTAWERYNSESLLGIEESNALISYAGIRYQLRLLGENIHDHRLGTLRKRPEGTCSE